VSSGKLSKIYKFYKISDSESIPLPEGKRPVGRTKRRWMDNIKVDCVEILLGSVKWIGLAPDRYRWRPLVNAVTSIRVPSNAGKLQSGCKILAS
jgi:hypothetical protein